MAKFSTRFEWTTFSQHLSTTVLILIPQFIARALTELDQRDQQPKTSGNLRLESKFHPLYKLVNFNPVTILPFTSDR